MVKTTFLEFREQCIWLRCCYNTYSTLYESGAETIELLSNAANIFFGDLHKILIEYGWLQVCKITDPAKTKTRLGYRDNLTVKYIDALLSDKGLMTNEIRQYSTYIHNYRKLLKPGRNWVISHLDKETILTGKPVGEHSHKEIEDFFDNLQKYADAVGNVIGVGPLDFRVTVGPGDVTDLIMKLKGHAEPFAKL